ncbi:MAG TPA: ABC transporter substrate-binding protein [Albitalea sp.]|uniref:ABC transporter substrate-binding protein n=1 Tax=Piscinibacter sp. TaxID=1903157 RepID=UPI002ED44CB6
MADPATAGSKPPIVLGTSGEFSGQAVAKENIDGAMAYFASVNKRGGVFGRNVELKVYDDGRDVRRTVTNTERLIAEDRAFALFGYRSTPSVEAALPILTRNQVPLIAPFSGAESIRSPANPLVFHLRASYRQEAAKLVHQLSTVGVRRVALLYQDDAFGKDAAAGFEEALKDAGLAPLVTATYDRKDLNVESAVRSIGQASSEAVLMACSPRACLDFIKAMRAEKHRCQFLTLSNVNSDEFAKGLGNDTRGVVVAQVMPSPWSHVIPLAREYRQALKDSGSGVPVSYASFEGFAAAKLVVTALRLAGPDPTRERFMAALESMRELDLGGLTVRFFGTDHRGSNFVELTFISQGGKYIR